MPKIVLKPKYRGKKDASVVVSSNRKIVLKKKYRKPKINVRNLASQIARINCEKKEYNVYAPSLTVGQFTVASAGANPTSGHYLSSAFTPQPGNGTSDTTRLGDEISVTGIRNVFQFSHQVNTSQPVRCKIMFVAPKFGVSGASLTIDKLLNVNPVVYYGNGANVGVYDITSSRNMDYIKDFKVLRTYSFKMPGDTASLSQKAVKTVNVGLKFKRPWKVRFDSGNNVSFGQIYCLILAESGNVTVNAPSSNIVGLPVIDTYSGLNFQWYSKTYYIDP